jgi:hypothetical protein
MYEERKVIILYQGMAQKTKTDTCGNHPADDLLDA